MADNPDIKKKQIDIVIIENVFNDHRIQYIFRIQIIFNNLHGSSKLFLNTHDFLFNMVKGYTLKPMKFICDSRKKNN